MAKKDDSTTLEAAPTDMKRLDFVPKTWDEVAEAIGTIVEFEGSPYEVVDKETLLGKPFLIVDIRLNTSGEYGEFVSICALTEANDRIVFNDGSTGILAQAKDLLGQGLVAGVVVKRGLRKSEYTYQETDFDGKPVIDPKTGKEKPPTPATTYYLG